MARHVDHGVGWGWVTALFVIGAFAIAAAMWPFPGVKRSWILLGAPPTSAVVATAVDGLWNAEHAITDHRHWFWGLGAVIVAGFGVMVTGGVVALASAGRANASESAEQVALVIGLAVAVASAIALVNAGVIFDYNDTDSFGRFFIALLGVVVVGGGLWYYFKHDRSDVG